MKNTLNYGQTARSRMKRIKMRHMVLKNMQCTMYNKQNLNNMNYMPHECSVTTSYLYLTSGCRFNTRPLIKRYMMPPPLQHILFSILHMLHICRELLARLLREIQQEHLWNPIHFSFTPYIRFTKVNTANFTWRCKFRTSRQQNQISNINLRRQATTARQKPSDDSTSRVPTPSFQICTLYLVRSLDKVDNRLLFCHLTLV